MPSPEFLAAQLGIEQRQLGIHGATRLCLIGDVPAAGHAQRQPESGHDVEDRLPKPVPDQIAAIGFSISFS